MSHTNEKKEEKNQKKSDLLTARTWAEVSYKSLENNYLYLHGLAPNSKFLGLCKADGYGHGALWVAKSLEKCGADILAVACVSEAIDLREGGITLPILILGDTPTDFTHLLLQYNLTQTVHCKQQAENLSAEVANLNGNLQIHIKVDTGMGRLGLLPTEIDHITTLCEDKHLTVSGIYTHFATADEINNPYYTRSQYNKFRQILTKLEEEKIKIPLIHCANSGATLFHLDTHNHMIRPGIALYGYNPDGNINQNLSQVLSLYSRISALRHLPKDSKIGYGSTYALENDSLIAVLPIGYGDGYPRCENLEVLICDVLCPVLGRVCMDMMMVDVTEIQEKVVVGDVATLYGSHNLLESTAKKANTISYDLLCRLTPRIPRIPVD